jgi:hypothetical protein
LKTRSIVPTTAARGIIFCSDGFERFIHRRGELNTHPT